MQPARGISPYLLLTLPPLFWAFNWIIGRGLASNVPPMAMTFFRWLFAIALLAPFAWRHALHDWPRIRAHWKFLALLGAVGITAHNALVYLGLQHTTATNGVILNSFIPVLIVILSWVFLRERLAAAQLAGIAISLGGVLVILSGGSASTLLELQVNGGDILLLLSMLMWSVYTILLRWRPAALHVMSFLLVVAVAGAVCVLPFLAIEMALGRHVQWTWTNAGAIVAVALLSSVLAYLCWNRGVAEVGANVAGLFVHLMPAFGIVLAWMFLGERLAPYHIGGIVLILAGIFLMGRFQVAAAGED